MPNQWNIDYSKPGFCSKCHDAIAEFDGWNKLTGAPIITKLKPNFRQANFLLSDGSSMNIAMCEQCYDNLKPEDAGEIMESEINGWQEECNLMVRLHDNPEHLVDAMNGNAHKGWPKEKAIAHMERYSQLSISNRMDRPWPDEDLGRVKKPRKSKLKVNIEEEAKPKKAKKEKETKRGNSN